MSQIPFDTEAEAGALACVLLADAEAASLLSKLTFEDFHDIRHQNIYSELKALARDGKPINSVTLAQRLREQGTIAEAGGMAYLAALPDATPSAKNFPSFLETVKTCAVRRAVLGDARTLAQIANDPRQTAATIGEAARRLAESYATRPTGLPAIVDAASFVTNKQTAPPELVKGVLHKGSKLVLGGGSKSFKTWTLLDLAISVGHGLPWLGFETTPGPVLYVNFEIQDYAWQERIAKVASAKQIEMQSGAVSLWNLRGHASEFSELLPQVASETRDKGFSLIVLDPVYKLYGRTDENSARDVAALVNAMEALAVRTGAAVAFAAHFSKGNQSGKEAIDRISGSGVFARDPDSILVFTRHEQEEAFAVESILRNFSPVEPFAVRWEFPLFARDGELDPAKLKQVAGRKKKHTCEDVLALLGDRTLTTTEWQKLAKNEAGIGNGTFFALLKELRKSPHIIQSAIDDKWTKVYSV